MTSPCMCPSSPALATIIHLKEVPNTEPDFLSVCPSVLGPSGRYFLVIFHFVRYTTKYFCVCFVAILIESFESSGACARVCPVAIMGRACWIALVVCLSVVCRDVVADDFSEFQAADKKVRSCEKVCKAVGVEPSQGCQLSPKRHDLEEVVVITNGDSDIGGWNWDRISMVVSSFYSSSHKIGLAACTAHSKGKRYGLRESVQLHTEMGKFAEFLGNFLAVVRVDHIVFDLLDAFSALDTVTNATDKSSKLAKLTTVLKNATETTRTFNDREVYCIVPWEPPCESDCSHIKTLLQPCQVLLLSPDSYMPKPEAGICTAGATVPVSKFLYGIERYLSMQRLSIDIVAGIPWHGYSYPCTKNISQTDDCHVQPISNTSCFDSTNRERKSLAEIHNSNIPEIGVKMDNLNQAVFYNVNDTTQMWFENFTTLHIKYSLVKDLKLRGLSLWTGEDMAIGSSVGKAQFALHSWDFLMHNLLHKVVHDPVVVRHYYADTVAGVGVGCMLLGTALGVTFTCIAFKRGSYRGRSTHRPFKLDEDMDAYRDDEGL
ncbi:di-N-acetylchitobiase-like [Littorina saxatilis]|uniref:di-N-acetylchitobiase-like n=1 Tax=Littorina saxatilis TaxID=31220 RepID=UPI0038B65CEC